MERKFVVCTEHDKRLPSNDNPVTVFLELKITSSTSAIIIPYVLFQDSNDSYEIDKNRYHGKSIRALTCVIQLRLCRVILLTGILSLWLI